MIALGIAKILGGSAVPLLIAAGVAWLVLGVYQSGRAEIEQLAELNDHNVATVQRTREQLTALRRNEELNRGEIAELREQTAAARAKVAALPAKGQDSSCPPDAFVPWPDG